MPTIAVQGYVASLAIRQDKAKARASDLLPVIAEFQARGAASLRAITAELKARRIETARGGEWSAVQVKRVLERA